MVFRKLFRDIVLIIFLQVLDFSIILNHFHIHVGHAQAEDVVFVIRISDFGNGIIKDVEADLVIKIIVCVLV